MSLCHWVMRKFHLVSRLFLVATGTDPKLLRALLHRISFRMDTMAAVTAHTGLLMFAEQPVTNGALFMTIQASLVIFNFILFPQGKRPIRLEARINRMLIAWSMAGSAAYSGLFALWIRPQPMSPMSDSAPQFTLVAGVTVVVTGY